MTDNDRLLSVLLTALMVFGAVSSAGAGSVAAAAGNTAGNATTFHVQQGAQCYDVQALGDGTQSVENFYDYRPNASGDYSSHGTTHLQDNQESKLFVYNGTNGYSVVFLNDKYSSDAEYGGTVTFNFSGMPTDGDSSWVVQDDSYGESTDDQWDTSGSEQGVNWMWSDGRNDGGAFLGIEGEEFTITPKFNEDAHAWGDWPYSNDSTNRTTAWKLIRADHSEETLDRNQKLTVGTGSCSDSGGEDTTDPSAALSASPNPAGNNDEVTLDASNSTDSGGSGIAEYRWDFDGDGVTDDTTSSPTATHAYTTGSYNASVTVVDGNDNSDVANTTVEVKSGSINYVNATAVEVEGTYEKVTGTVAFYSQSGLATSHIKVENVSGTTLITTDVTGVNGSMITVIETHKNASTTEPYLRKQHSRYDYYSEAIKPEPVTVSVQNVTETGPGTYDVTFAYDNQNDEALKMRDSTLSGNVAGDAPREVEPGEHTFTVSWNPQSDSEKASWTLNRGNFQQSDVSATTKSAGEYGGSDSAPPKAALSAPDEVDESQTLVLNARKSSDDEGIDHFKYYVNGELLWQEDNYTTAHPWRTEEFPDGPGTYEISVKAVDTDGQTDWASTNVTIVPDEEIPSAEISVSGTKKVGEDVTFTATDLSEKPDRHEHICWKLDGEKQGCWVEDGKHDSDWKSWTTSFDESGDKTVTLVLQDHAGNNNTVEKTIHVAAESSDGGDNGDDGDNNDGDNNNGGTNNPGQGGFTGGDTSDSKQDGIDTADPEEDQQSVSKPLTEVAGPVGSVTLQPAESANDSGVELLQTAPKGVEVPTAAANGFEAISYLDVTGAEQVTFSVSKAKLTDMGASAEDVSLFRYDDGSWTAVETTVVNETADAYRVRANATGGVFAVGVDRAATGVTDLSVNSQRVEAGEQVTITATVENTGRADGEHEVTLSVGGEEVTTKTVSVGAGETAEVTFDRTFESSGTYEISVGDANAEVVVESVETQTSTTDESDEGSSGGSDASDGTTTDDDNNGSGVPGFGVGVSLVALLAAALIALRRR